MSQIIVTPSHVLLLFQNQPVQPGEKQDLLRVTAVLYGLFPSNDGKRNDATFKTAFETALDKKYKVSS